MIRDHQCSEDHDDGNDESVQTNSLGENEDKDHTYEDVISLGIGSDTGITGNTNGKTSSTWWLAEALNLLSKNELMALIHRRFRTILA